MRGNKYISADNRNFKYSRSMKSNSQICGILNLGNNCYLNSGLKILTSCKELVDQLKKSNYNGTDKNIISILNDAFYILLNNIVYNIENFINYFYKLNYDFTFRAQCIFIKFYSYSDWEYR